MMKDAEDRKREEAAAEKEAASKGSFALKISGNKGRRKLRMTSSLQVRVLFC
jgi:hypothetical protein